MLHSTNIYIQSEVIRRLVAVAEVGGRKEGCAVGKGYTGMQPATPRLIISADNSPSFSGMLHAPSTPLL